MSAERDPLEELLVREPYIDDAGFTERVMDRLPVPRRDPRPWVLGFSGMVAAVLAVAYLPAALGELLAAAGAAARGLALPALTLAIGAAALACLAAAAVATAAVTRRG